MRNGGGDRKEFYFKVVLYFEKHTNLENGLENFVQYIC